MENRLNTRHKDVAMTTIPDLSVCVRAARGGDCPGSLWVVDDSAVAVEGAMRYGSDGKRLPSLERISSSI